MSNRVLELLKTGALGNGEILKTITKILDDRITEISPILRLTFKAFASHLHSATELSTKQTEELVKILTSSCQAIFKLQDGISKLENSLFHIMANLIRLNKLNEAVLISNYTKQYSVQFLKPNSSTASTDVKSIIKNCYLLFWTKANGILSEELLDKCNQGLRLRFEALEYYLMCEHNVVELIQRAFQAVALFLSSCKNMSAKEYELCQKIDENILLSTELYGDVTKLPDILLEYHKWTLKVGEAEQKYKNKQTSISIYLRCNTLLKKLFSGSSVPRDDVCVKCVELMNLGFDLFTKFEDDNVCKSFRKLCSNLEKIFTKEFAAKNNSVLQLALFIIKLLQSYDRHGKNPLNYELTTWNEEKFFCLKSSLFFHLRLLSIERDCSDDLRYNSIQTNFSLSFKIMQSVLHLFVHTLSKTKSDLLFNIALSEAKNVIADVKKLISKSKEFAPDDGIVTLGILLSDFGKVLYKRGFYGDSIPFLTVSCNILMNWCLRGKVYENVKARILRVKLEEKHSILICSLRRINEYEECLSLLTDIIAHYPQLPTEFINAWVQVKNDFNANSATALKAMTICQGLKKFNVENDKVFKLLHMELKVYKMQKFITLEEQKCVLRDMLSVASNPLEHGMALVEFVQLQWFKQCEGEKSALECSEEAIEFLKSYLKKTEDGQQKIDALNQLATAYYWQYLAQLQVLQNAVSVEITLTDITPLDRKLFRHHVEDEEESEGTCDVVPAYANTSVEREMKSLKSLNEAVDLWEKIISPTNAIFLGFEQTINDLQTAAEVYALAQHALSEIRAWRLVRQLSLRTGHNTSYIVSTSRLIRTLCRSRKFFEVKSLIDSCSALTSNLKCDCSDETYAYMIYHLAVAEYCLWIGNVDKGLKILTKLWSHSFLYTKPKSRLSRLISADIRLLVSQFLLLPRNFYTSKTCLESSPWKNNAALDLATEGLKLYVDLGRLLSKDSNEKIQPPTLGHRIVSSLMDASVLVAQMFLDVGAPREAKFCLKEQFVAAQRLALGLRTSEFLVGLANVDIVCDNYNGCKVKLNGIQSVIRSNPSRKPCKQNGLNDLDRNLMHKTGIKCPDFFSHSRECLCAFCAIPMINQIALKMFSVQAECLAFNGALNDAVQMARMVLKLADRNTNNSMNDLPKNEARLQISRFLRSQEKYFDALTLVNNSLKHLRELKYTDVKILTLLPYLQYEKCICSLHVLAVKENKIPFELAKQFWKINKTATLKPKPISLIESMNILGGNFSEVECLQVPKPLSALTRRLKIINEANVTTGFPNDNLSPSSLCQAPKKKTKKLVTRQKNIIEPSESSESESEAKVTKPKMKLRTKTFSSQATKESQELKINLSSSDSDSENKSHKQKSVLTSVTQTKGPAQRPILQESNGRRNCSSDLFSEDESKGENIIVSTKIAEESSSVTGRVTRSRAKATKNTSSSSISSEEISSKVPTKRNVTRASRVKSIKPRKELSSAIETLRNGSDQSDDSDCRVIFLEDENVSNDLSTIEIFRGGGEKEKTKNDIEDVEKLRKTEENSFNDFRLSSEKDFDLKSVVSWLKKCFDYVSHHPTTPLYTNLCLTLALLQGNENPLTAYYLSESCFVTLRHQCNINLGKKINELQQLDLTSVDDTRRVAIEALKNFKEITHFSNYSSSNDIYSSFEKQLNIIPKEWTVCQISVVPSHFYKGDNRINPPLLLSQYRANKKPIVVTVYPEDLYETDVPRTLLREFFEIHEESLQTMKSDDKVIWWESRRNLDNRMENLVSDLENVWIRHWKGLFLGRPITKENQEYLSTAVREVLARFPLPSSVNEALVEILIDSIPWLSKEQLQQGVKDLYGCATNSTKMNQIIDIMRQKTSTDVLKSMDRHSVVLILGKEVACLPWESMPILRSRSTSRMPSLSLLAGHLSWHCSQDKSIFLQGADTRKTYFVLNPSNDLPHTQEKFEDWFVEREKWLGVIGRPPTKNEFLHGLSAHDLFVYCGHGTGNTYLSGDVIQGLFCTAVALLMGCSSGKLRTRGTHLEPSGTVLQYILAGCPCVVADLWDVTDRDIDRFLEGVLNFWTASKGDLLTNVVTQARSGCRLPFLIGAAPVVYGLPVRIKLQ